MTLWPTACCRRNCRYRCDCQRRCCCGCGRWRLLSAHNGQVDAQRFRNRLVQRFGRRSIHSIQSSNYAKQQRRHRADKNWLSHHLFPSGWTGLGIDLEDLPISRLQEDGLALIVPNRFVAALITRCSWLRVACCHLIELVGLEERAARNRAGFITF